MSAMLQHLLLAYKYGHKQLYYFNTHDGSGDDINEREQIVLEAPSEEQFEEDCDSCTI